jgi:hypothetical protein
MKRYAIVFNAPLDTVKDYLPSNYTASWDSLREGVVISGIDDHGWTLDGYVIPRLMSGLIVATEV